MRPPGKLSLSNVCWNAGVPASAALETRTAAAARMRRIMTALPRRQGACARRNTRWLCDSGPTIGPFRWGRQQGGVAFLNQAPARPPPFDRAVRQAGRDGTLVDRVGGDV